MPKAKLTELAVARVKPPAEGRREIWDAALPGFGLRITATGARSWVVAMRKPGAKHPARVKIGEPPEMGLSEARDRARALMRDPGALAVRDKLRLRGSGRSPIGFSRRAAPSAGASCARRHLGNTGARCSAMPSRCTASRWARSGAPTPRP
jgi:Arm DNA-binding domain